MATTTAAATYCGGCGCAFNLLVRRRQCRGCNRYFCDECAWRRVQRGKSKSSVQVCERCATPSIRSTTKVPTGGGDLIVTGSNLGTRASEVTIRFAGGALGKLTVLGYSAGPPTKIRLAIPPGVGAHMEMIASVPTLQVEGRFTFSYAAPAVDDVVALSAADASTARAAYTSSSGSGGATLERLAASSTGAGARRGVPSCGGVVIITGQHFGGAKDAHLVRVFVGQRKQRSSGAEDNDADSTEEDAAAITLEEPSALAVDTTSGWTPAKAARRAKKTGALYMKYVWRPCDVEHVETASQHNGLGTILAQLPPGHGEQHPLLIDVGGQHATHFVSYAPPTIVSASTTEAQGGWVTVRGASLGTARRMKRMRVVAVAPEGASEEGSDGAVVALEVEAISAHTAFRARFAPFPERWFGEEEEEGRTDETVIGFGEETSITATLVVELASATSSGSEQRAAVPLTIKRPPPPPPPLPAAVVLAREEEEEVVVEGEDDPEDESATNSSEERRRGGRRRKGKKKKKKKKKEKEKEAKKKRIAAIGWDGSIESNSAVTVGAFGRAARQRQMVDESESEERGARTYSPRGGAAAAARREHKALRKAERVSKAKQRRGEAAAAAASPHTQAMSTDGARLFAGQLEKVVCLARAGCANQFVLLLIVFSPQSLPACLLFDIMFSHTRTL